MNKKVVGIICSYRKGGIIDSIVSEILTSAEEHGAQTNKIYLIDKHIEFCTNCRKCTQLKGSQRGKCIHNDDMEEILKEIENADSIVIGSPVNFYNVTAITRRFMERLICFAYWPWGKTAPKFRTNEKSKKAILVTSSAMPVFLGKIFTGALRALKITAKILGAKPIKSIFIGLIAGSEKETLSESVLRKARKAGCSLMS